ncbi:hypothetical protein L1S32_10140 [Methanogenium sp. S4BF]|uniref:hypothetical protein n=1 Tax=Methanogenium sp. S4BF TaxID=1789226 RepID=UPI002417B778|nr:hypothetical protein [Methanogenium sp. S4BF]WFN34193.1 hypothetical protein L1S32_10140 [Methanogenium sp. S4BF]
MKRTQIAGIAGIGICIFVILALFAPIFLVLTAGCLAGAALVYAMLLAAPAQYDEEEQDITEDEILFVYDD